MRREQGEEPCRAPTGRPKHAVCRLAHHPERREGEWPAYGTKITNAVGSAIFCLFQLSEYDWRREQPAPIHRTPPVIVSFVCEFVPFWLFVSAEMEEADVEVCCIA